MANTYYSWYLRWTHSLGFSYELHDSDTLNACSQDLVLSNRLDYLSNSNKPTVPLHGIDKPTIKMYSVYFNIQWMYQLPYKYTHTSSCNEYTSSKKDIIIT